jgi:small GTP-binding protein
MEASHYSVRTVMAGDASVGKTSILKRYLKNTFNPAEVNTVGASVETFTRSFHSREIEIGVWDTAGQEQYRALGPVYFRNAAAALIVFDVTSRSSYENLTYWIQSIRSATDEKVFLMLIGNKIDLPDRVIAYEEAAVWASEHQCRFVESSAKTGQGVNLIFDELVATLGPTIEQQKLTTTMAEPSLVKTTESTCC